MKNNEKKFLVILAALSTVYCIIDFIAKKQKSESIYDKNPEEKNPMEGKNVIFVEDSKDKKNADGVCGHLEAVGDKIIEETIYDKYIKRAIDKALAFGGLVVLSPVFLIIALLIKLEDPGPVLFTQKRVGQNKRYFKLHKFRSMRMDTPHDVPTHMLSNPDQYITKVGKFIRAHSLDELPQIWDIFIGNMSVIGPRPGLWNQDKLTALRDQYDANDIKPGLTGWAQINGRDELELEDKAKLDGEYAKNRGPRMDAKCFLGSLHVFGNDESAVEGGTGEINKSSKTVIIPEDIMVSVVMATYRRDKSLKRALLSLVDQTFGNFEVVLVDDNDNKEWTEKVRAIVNDLSEKISINYIINEKNMGSAATRNIGINASKGQYITFLDDDDEYLPEKIENQLKGMIMSGADYGITDLTLYNEQNEVIDKRVRTFIKSTKTNELMRYHLREHLTGTDTFMFKTNYLRQIGGFPGIDIGDEFYLMKEAILGNGKFHYEEGSFIKAYVHTGENEGLSSGESKINGENVLFEEKKNYFDSLSQSDIRYIKMRHYAVIAFAEIRRKNVGAFLYNTIKSIFTSPLGSLKLYIDHKRS